MIDLEHDVANALAQRLGRAADDLDVRIAANASIGVLRAAIRAAFTTDRGDILHEAIDAGLARIAPIFPAPVAGADYRRTARRTQVVSRRRPAAD